MRDRGPFELTPGSPRIAFRRYGQSGPQVLFIMGFGVRGAAWTPQVEDLQKDHRLIVMDNRGVGSSPDRPRFPLSMRELAEDATRVLDAAGWSAAHVVGTSMGGMVAQELALRAPARVRSLTLVATHPGGGSARPTARAVYLLARTTVLPRQSLDQAYELLYPRHFVTAENRPLILEHWRQIGRPAHPMVLWAQAAAIARHDTRRRLSQIRVPTLVVRPGLDILVPPRGSDELARLIPGATLLRFDDAGHGVTHQKAAELNVALRKHIGRADDQVQLAAAG